MFSHILVGTNDVLAAKKFYDAVMETLGIPSGELNEEKQRIYYRSPTASPIVTKPIDGNPASVGNGSTIGFKCASAEQAKAFHDAAIVAGGTSIEDPPGWRVNGDKKMFLAYVRDLDGNKLNAIFLDIETAKSEADTTFPIIKHCKKITQEEPDKVCRNPFLRTQQCSNDS